MTRLTAIVTCIALASACDKKEPAPKEVPAVDAAKKKAPEPTKASQEPPPKSFCMAIASKQ